MKPRKPKATSLQFALDTAADLAKAQPEPPFELTERALAHWNRIRAAKRPDAWTTIDLVHAAHLAHDFVLLEDLRATLSGAKLGSLAPDSEQQGQPDLFAPSPVTNIADLKRVAALIDATQSRILSACRALQINAASTQGRARDQAGRNAEARRILHALYPDADDDLIARPSYGDDDDLFA